MPNILNSFAAHQRLDRLALFVKVAMIHGLGQLRLEIMTDLFMRGMLDQGQSTRERASRVD